MQIPINNQQTLSIVPNTKRRGYDVVTKNEHGDVTRWDFIPEHEVVMLYDYWTACKEGLEQSDYIAEE